MFFKASRTCKGLALTTKIQYADVAHLVERHLAKVEVAGSSPVIRSTNKKNRFPWEPVFASKRITGLEGER